MPKCRRRMTSVRSIVCTDRLRPIADRLCWSSACLCNRRPPRKAPLSHSANLVRLFELQTLPHSVQTSSASSRSALRTRSKLAAYGAPTASPVSVAHLASRFVYSSTSPTSSSWLWTPTQFQATTIAACESDSLSDLADILFFNQLLRVFKFSVYRTRCLSGLRVPSDLGSTQKTHCLPSFPFKLRISLQSRLSVFRLRVFLIQRKDKSLSQLNRRVQNGKYTLVIVMF